MTASGSAADRARLRAGAGRGRSRPAKIVFLCAAVLVVAMLWKPHGALLTWDDVDYWNAARLGFVANYAEQGSLSASDFITFARGKRAGTARLPAAYAEETDPLILRHHHPPLGVYVLVPFAKLEGDRAARLGQLLGAVVLVGVTLWAYLSLARTPTWTGCIAVGALAVWASAFQFFSLSFHGWAALTCTLTAACLSRWLSAGDRVAGWLCAGTLGVAVVTQQPAAVLWLAVAVAIVIWRGAPGTRRWPWSAMLVGAGVSLVVAFLLWPGGFLKISLVKIPALHVYRLVLGKEYAVVAERAGATIEALLPGLAAVVVAVLVLGLTERATIRIWGPLLVVGGLYGVALSRFARHPMYLLPALSALVPLVGLAIDHFETKRLRRLACLTIVALAVLGGRELAAIPLGDEAMRRDLAWLRGVLVDRVALADGGHIYAHYLGPSYAITPILVDYGDTELRIRVRGAYRPLTRQDVAGRVVMVRRERAAFFGSPAERELLATCAPTERHTFRAYDCR